jgi:hypothetical protein
MQIKQLLSRMLRYAGCAQAAAPFVHMFLLLAALGGVTTEEMPG